MVDERLRELERASKTDPAAHVVYRRMLIRLGRAEEAGLEVGDLMIYKGHRQQIVRRSELLKRESHKGLAANRLPGRRVYILCADTDQHPRSIIRAGPRAGEHRCPVDRVWVNLDSKAVGVLAEPADPPGEKLPVGEGEYGPRWQLMTEVERDAACHLAACSFTPGTSAKRIARALSEQATREVPERREITQKQRRVLWELVWSYRRQIPKAILVDEARAILDARGMFNT